MKIKYSTRVVIILKKIVVKIPINRKGYLQGKNEKYLFEKYNHLKLLGILKYEIFGIVIMKKYEIAKSITEFDVINIKEKIVELNILNCDLFNYKNWGIDNNKKILVDYGINKYISTLY